MTTTEITAHTKKLLTLRRLPFNIKKSDIESFKVVVPINKSTLNTEYKKDVIYNASENDFLKGKYRNLVITNTLNTLKCSSRTVGSYMCGEEIQLTSDGVTKLIGQKNYDTLFTALCSIINPQLRIEAILALLTENKQISVETQTAVSHSAQFIKERASRNKTKRKTVSFYPVKDEMLKEVQIKKVIIDPENVKLIESEHIKSASQGKTLPELNLDEDSNMSNLSFGNMSIGSNFSVGSLIDLITDPKSTFDTVNRHTDVENIYTNVTMLDNTSVTIKGNPDIFHLTSPEVLEGLSISDRKKLMYHQAYIDWKFSLHRDYDGNLPFHHAVMNNDEDLLKRHCAMLKTRNVSVDIPADENRTALQMAIQHDSSKCTEILLQHGADVFIVDEDDRNILHLAADVSIENIKAILSHCKRNAREILRDSHSWTMDMENKTDEELASILVNELCTTFDNSGYTPLMIASKNAKYENVSLLVKSAPTTINMQAPTSGDTALYLAVGAACIQSRDSNDQTKVSTDFLKTVEVLMKNGAVPAIENLSGNNINTLLTEFYLKDLSVLIANEFTSLNYFDGKLSKQFSEYVIVKNENGVERMEEIKTKLSVNDNSDKVVVKSVKIVPAKNVVEGSSKSINASTNKSVVLDNRKPIILRKPIKLNVNNSKLISIFRTQNIKRSSGDISKDITSKKIKSLDML